MARVRPIGQLALFDPVEDLVELGFGDQKGVVQPIEVVLGVDEIQGGVVADPEHHELAERAGGV